MNIGGVIRTLSQVWGGQRLCRQDCTSRSLLRPQPYDGVSMMITDDDGNVDLSKCVAALSKELAADIWLYSGAINDYGLGEVIKSIPDKGQATNVFLVLVTNGGSANAAFQIASVLQEIYGQLFIFIPSYCKSAGTLIATGANRLFMDVFSELGPIDVQLNKPNEIATDKSGLLSGSTFHALTEAAFDMFEQFMLKITLSSNGIINFKVAAEVSSSLTTGLMSGIYNQINPDVVGSDYRDLNVAMHYGMRLAAKAENCSNGTIMNLVKNYPSHDFIIGLDEAKNLFERVDKPTELMYALVGVLGEIAYQEASSPVVVNFSNEEELGYDDGSDPAGGEQQDDGTVAKGQKADRGGDPGPRGEPAESVRINDHPGASH